MKKIWSVLLCILLVLSLIATGCTPTGSDQGGPTQGTSTEKPTGGESTPGSDLPEVVKLVLPRPIFSKSPQGTDVEEKWHEMMEEYLGVKLDITWEELPFGEFMEKMPIYKASDDWGDAFLAGLDDQEILEYGQAGRIVNLLDYPDSIKNYMKYLENPVNKQTVSSADGNIYFFGDISVSSHTGTQSTFSYRFDAFKALDIKIPETLEEYYQAAKKIKSEYPDSYPLGGWDTNVWDVFLAINHTSNRVLYDGEKFIYGPVDREEAFKETLVYLNKLYAEGLLDPEFITNNDEEVRAKMINDKVFMVPFFWGSWIYEFVNTNPDRPDVEWGIANVLKSYKGEPGWLLNRNKKGVNVVPWKLIVNGESEYPELVVKMIDYQYSDEMFTLANYGIEGVTFEIDENGEKQFMSHIKEAEDPTAELAKYGVNISMSVRSGIQWMPQDNDAAIKLMPPVPCYHNGDFYEDVFWKFYSETYPEDARPPIEPPLAYTDEENEVIANNTTALNTYVDEEMAKFINGTRSFDEWDSFIAELKNYGDYEAVLDIMNGKLNQ